MLKQKVYILMFFIFFISLPSYPQYPITNGSLSKNCEDLLEENIVNYKLCEGWLLDKDAVTDIIQHKEVAHILNPVRDLSPFDMLIYYSIDVIENNISYHLTVYATSWLSLYNKEMKSIKYYYCNSEKCTGYFIGNPINERLLSESNRAYSWGDEEEALKRITDNKNKVIGFLENNTLDIKWFGTYTFPDYELMIDENGCEIKKSH